MYDLVNVLVHNVFRAAIVYPVLYTTNYKETITVKTDSVTVNRLQLQSRQHRFENGYHCLWMFRTPEAVLTSCGLKVDTGCKVQRTWQQFHKTISQI